SPDRGTLLPRRRLQAHAFCMREKALGDRRKIVLDVEAHRKPRSVWRKRENEKANALGKGRSEVFAWTPLAHRLEDCADFPGFDRFIDIRAKQRGKDAFRLFRGGVGAVRPKDSRSVADLDSLDAVSFEKAVECCCIGEGRGFRDWSVLALLVTVRLKRGEIEGDNAIRVFSTPRTSDALDRRVQSRD